MTERLTRRSIREISTRVSVGQYDGAVVGLNKFIEQKRDPVNTIERLVDQLSWVGADLRSILLFEGKEDYTGIIDQKKVQQVIAADSGRIVIANMRKGKITIFEKNGRHKLYSVTLPYSEVGRKKQRKQEFSAVDHRLKHKIELNITSSSEPREYNRYLTLVNEGIAGVLWVLGKQNKRP